jgi:hypothetical protein
MNATIQDIVRGGIFYAVHAEVIYKETLVNWLVASQSLASKNRSSQAQKQYRESAFSKAATKQQVPEYIQN